MHLEILYLNMKSGLKTENWTQKDDEVINKSHKNRNERIWDIILKRLDLQELQAQTPITLYLKSWNNLSERWLKSENILLKGAIATCCIS